MWTVLLGTSWPSRLRHLVCRRQWKLSTGSQSTPVRTSQACHMRLLFLLGTPVHRLLCRWAGLPHCYWYAGWTCLSVCFWWCPSPCTRFLGTRSYWHLHAFVDRTHKPWWTTVTNWAEDEARAWQRLWAACAQVTVLITAADTTTALVAAWWWVWRQYGAAMWWAIPFFNVTLPVETAPGVAAVGFSFTPCHIIWATRWQCPFLCLLQNRVELLIDLAQKLVNVFELDDPVFSTLKTVTAGITWHLSGADIRATKRVVSLGSHFLFPAFAITRCEHIRLLLHAGAAGPAATFIVTAAVVAISHVFLHSHITRTLSGFLRINQLHFRDTAIVGTVWWRSATIKQWLQFAELCPAPVAISSCPILQDAPVWWLSQR